MALKKYHIMTILGTRPEVIKCAPVIKRIQHHPTYFKSSIIATAQHRQMLDQMLRQFELKPAVDLDLMVVNQSLEQLTSQALTRLGPIIRHRQPDLILVQGDTTTAFAGALAGFYHQIPVAHIEAGLRTYHRYNPYPEEANRRMIDVMASWHFAATASAQENLLKEGFDPKAILVTGNTVVDSLKATYDPRFDITPWCQTSRQLILVTMHRRESRGDDFTAILEAVKALAVQQPGVRFIFPVHPNPQVKRAIEKVLKKTPKNLYLLPPLDYNVFINLLARARLVITDSGGLQEEAAALGLPAIVCRRTTERPEALSAGARLVAPDKELIIKQAMILINQASLPSRRPRPARWPRSPFGDGLASKRIMDMLLWISGKRARKPRAYQYQA